MCVTGLLDRFMMSQLNCSHPLCWRVTRLNLGSLTQGLWMTFRSWICIREISRIVAYVYSSHVHVYIWYDFPIPIPPIKGFMFLQTSSLKPERVERLNFLIWFSSDLLP